MGYQDLAKEFPRIRIQFDSFVLPIVDVITDDEELIEDMFSRLNEAATLNAAEKRNALGGAVVTAIRDISGHQFFSNKVKFSNKRRPLRNPTQPKQTIEAVAFLKIVLAVIKSKKLSRNTKKPSEFHLIYRLLPAFTDSRRIGNAPIPKSI